MWFISLLLRTLAMGLSCSFTSDKFLCFCIFSFCLSVCLLLYVKKKKKVCFLLLVSIGLWRRDHVVPGSGSTGNVPGVCCVRSAVLFWLLYLSGPLSAEALLAWYEQYLVPGLNGQILTRCALVCLCNKTPHHLHQNWGSAKLSGLRAGLLGGGALYAETEASISEKGNKG